MKLHLRHVFFVYEARTKIQFKRDLGLSLYVFDVNSLKTSVLYVLIYENGCLFSSFSLCYPLSSADISEERRQLSG